MGEFRQLFYAVGALVLICLGAYVLAIGATGTPKDFLSYWSFDAGLLAFGFSFLVSWDADKESERQTKELARLTEEVKKLREQLFGSA
jgi:hypothetical protein